MITVPDLDVIFELTLDPAIRGLDMVVNEFNADMWRFSGKEITGLQTKCFMLLRVGYYNHHNLEQVLPKLTTKKTKPSTGLAREAFKKDYPMSDGKGPIGFPDPSWWYTSANFPMLGSHGGQKPGEPWRSGFYPANYWHGVEWRWLVEVK